MIIVNEISKEYLAKTLFEKVSFSLRKGDRAGLIGPNGSGKSTIIKIILGEFEPDSGQVKIESERIGYLPQELPFAPEETIESFLGFSDKIKIKNALSKVNFNTTVKFSERGEEHEIRATEKLDPNLKISTLSGGQKTKLALAKIFLQRPSFLLLDEPTNHLDFRGLEWLEEFINNFKGGVLIISHDRRFLDNTVNKILELDSSNERFLEFKGNYTDFMIVKEKRLEKEGDEFEKQQEHKRKLELWLALKKQEATLHADPKKGKQVRAIKKRLEREVYSQELRKPKTTRAMGQINFSGETNSDKLLLKFKEVNKRFGQKSILSNVSFEIRGQDHVLLKGENGSGKTTIIKIAIGLIKPDSGEVRIGEAARLGYFAQEHEVLDPANNVEQELLQTPGLKKLNQDPRKILGRFLFSGNDIFKKVKDLSLGERVRLIFAKITHQQNELLLLDEPTNHLDIYSREIIEDALMEFDGAILTVSHDRYFLDKIKFNRTLELENKNLKEIF